MVVLGKRSNGESGTEPSHRQMGRMLQGLAHASCLFRGLSCRGGYSHRWLMPPCKALGRMLTRCPAGVEGGAGFGVSRQASALLPTFALKLRGCSCHPCRGSHRWRRLARELTLTAGSCRPAGSPRGFGGLKGIDDRKCKMRCGLLGPRRSEMAMRISERTGQDSRRISVLARGRNGVAVTKIGSEIEGAATHQSDA